MFVVVLARAVYDGFINNLALRGNGKRSIVPDGREVLRGNMLPQAIVVHRKAAHFGPAVLAGGKLGNLAAVLINPEYDAGERSAALA